MMMEQTIARPQTQRGLSKKWISFGTLMLGAGTIYKLGFMKDAFYVPMQEFMGLSHTQIGIAMSIAGWISTFGFLAALLVVDRISKKIMIPASLLGISACGLFLTTFPPYPAFLLIYCLLAVFADMLYWPTMLKTVRLLGNEDEQGRMFGILEAGRGLMDTIVAFCALGIFSAMGSTAAALRAAIIFYSVVPGVVAIIAYFLLEPDQPAASAVAADRNETAMPKENTIKRAMKNKNIWLVSMNVFFVYSVYCGPISFPFWRKLTRCPQRWWACTASSTSTA